MSRNELNWKLIKNSAGLHPIPRHGHRAVFTKNYMVVYGGGNDGIIDVLHVYNTTTNRWFLPRVKGDIPRGCAAYGFVADGPRLLIFGGMQENFTLSDELHELRASKWVWKKLTPKRPKRGSPPCARLGHSFTLVHDKVYLFGGLANYNEDPRFSYPRFLNDLYALDIRKDPVQWEIPETSGPVPSPRESHTSVAYVDGDTRKSFLVIYGGMNRSRLGDVWLLNIDSLTWSAPVISGHIPLPRSLHTSTLFGHRMFVFGGWVPVASEDTTTPPNKCTGTTACLNLETMNWEDLMITSFDGTLPGGRAGHCAAGIHNRLYIWSGRNGYRREHNKQVCYDDFWYVDVDKPPAPGRKAPPTQTYARLQIMKNNSPPGPILQQPGAKPTKITAEQHLPTGNVTFSNTGGPLQTEGANPETDSPIDSSIHLW